MIFSFFGFIRRKLRKKAKWKALNPKTRKLSACLLVCALYSLIFALTCGVAVAYEAPNIEVFQLLGLSATMAFLTLIPMSLVSNFAGVVISRAEHYQKLDSAIQKRMRAPLFSRARVASCRAGHARAHRSASRSSASKDSSSDGESDQGDPPAHLVSLFPSLNFPCSFYKLNNFLSPWRFLYGPGCWRVPSCSVFRGRGWGK
jgi:hypothetical protein